MSGLDPVIPTCSVADVEGWLGQPDCPFLLDVREDFEVAAGHIPGIHHIPLGELEARLSEVPRDRAIVAICKSGGRSGGATRFLSASGYQVQNMAGGMLAWRGPVSR
ncbi:MAG: rhodanese-like domain-containing protein [bacterium]|nr:rhodanese-like domain-containing protein [bacterium]